MVNEGRGEKRNPTIQSSSASERADSVDGDAALPSSLVIAKATASPSNEDVYDGDHTNTSLQRLHNIATGLKSELLQHQKVKDRSYHFRTYKQCVVASQVIDFILSIEQKSNLYKIKSRSDAVKLCITLQQHPEIQLWSHVVDPFKLFADDYLFFRFNERDDTISGESITETGSHGGGNELETDAVKVKTKTGKVNAAAASKYDKSFLDVLAIQLLDYGFEETLIQASRTYRLRKYKKCFVCSEVVDFMIEHKLAKTRAEAVDMGVALQTQIDFWHHVVDEQKHVFGDKYLFFRLSRDDDNMTARSRSSAGNSNKSSHSSHASSASVSSQSYTSDLDHIIGDDDDLGGSSELFSSRSSQQEQKLAKPTRSTTSSGTNQQQNRRRPKQKRKLNLDDFHCHKEG